jgi:hypothetical protein
LRVEIIGLLYSVLFIEWKNGLSEEGKSFVCASMAHGMGALSRLGMQLLNFSQKKHRGVGITCLHFEALVAPSGKHCSPASQPTPAANPRI